MSAAIASVSFRLPVLPWALSPQDEARFKRILRRVLITCLILCLVLLLLPRPKEDRSAPVVSATLLGIVSHRPQGDWLIGMPFYFCAVLQVAGTAIALRHFRRHPHQPVPATV